MESGSALGEASAGSGDDDIPGARLPAVAPQPDDETSLEAAGFASSPSAMTPEQARLVALLGKNMAAQWGNTSRVQTSSWGFYCPAEGRLPCVPTDDGDGKGLHESLDCFVCYAHRFRRLHPSFPRSGSYAAEKADEEVSGWLPPDIGDRVSFKVTDSIRYTGKNGNTSLKFHCSKYHPVELELFQLNRGSITPLQHRRRGRYGSRKAIKRTASGEIHSQPTAKRISGQCQASFADQVKQGSKAYGCQVLIPSPMVVEILANAGMDFVVLDLNSRPWAHQEMHMGMLASKSAGAATLIRLPCATEEAQMKQILELGPDGIILSGVGSAVQALEWSLKDTRLSGNSRALGFGAEKSTSMGNSLLVLLDITFSCACVDELAKALESDSFDGFFLDSDAITADEGMEAKHTVARAEEMIENSGKVLAGAASPSRSASKMFAAGYRLVCGTSDTDLLLSSAHRSISTAMG